MIWLQCLSGRRKNDRPSHCRVSMYVLPGIAGNGAVMREMRSKDRTSKACGRTEALSQSSSHRLKHIIRIADRPQTNAGHIHATLLLRRRAASPLCVAAESSALAAPTADGPHRRLGGSQRTPVFERFSATAAVAKKRGPPTVAAQKGVTVTSRPRTSPRPRSRRPFPMRI